MYDCRETKMFNPMTKHQFYSWMLDNLLFSTKKKLHDTEAIKYIFLIAHLEESTFSLLGKKCQSQLSQIIVKSRQLKSN